MLWGNKLKLLILGAGEIAQLVKYNHEDLIWVSSKLDMVVHMCNPKLGKLRQVDPWNLDPQVPREISS